MAKTTFSQKLALIAFGFVVTFLLLEAVLRLGGFLFLHLQEQANQKSAGAHGEYKILCLGESTTALGGENSYPRQLERILNSNQSKIKFKVINKGIPATTTDQILARTEIYLKEYHPDLVVSMMGINDPPMAQSEGFWELLSEKSRTIKLIHMVFQHLQSKQAEQKGDAFVKSLQSMEAKIDQRPTINDYNKLVEYYRGLNRPEQEFAVLTKSLALNPDHPRTNFLLGVYFERQAEYAKALSAFQKANAQGPNFADSFSLGDPEKGIVLSKIAECYKFLGDYPKAEKAYEEQIEKSPADPEAHGALADIYLEQKNFESAQKQYTQQIQFHPNSASAYSKLAYLYRLAGKEKIAEALLKQGEKVNPEAAEEKGKAPNSRTKKNYEQLAKILHRQGIPLLAVQYPVRSVRSLEQMLASIDGIVLVDNEKLFRDALAQGTYDEYFSDRFAGDFGHATPKGNALLAGHVADMILKEIVK